jgi:hypothetical protein
VQVPERKREIGSSSMETKKSWQRNSCSWEKYWKIVLNKDIVESLSLRNKRILP